MTDQELKKLVESNARTAQAILDSMAEARLERQELQEGSVRIQQGMVVLQDAMLRLADVQECIAKMLAARDEDHPTVLRKLTSIENKVDRLLEQSDREV